MKDNQETFYGVAQSPKDNGPTNKYRGFRYTVAIQKEILKDYPSALIHVTNGIITNITL